MKAAFVFSGQGAQAVGMGRDLYEKYDVCKKVFDTADEAVGWPVSRVSFEGPADKLTETRACQPAIYTMSVACLEAFRELYPDMKPAATAGLSLGEFSALYAADVYSYEDGVKLVGKRGEYMQEACENTNGAMASVLRADAKVIKETCDECGAQVANYNSPGQIVISGDAKKVKATRAALKEKGVSKVIPLKVAGAYHSELMKSAESKFEETLKSFEFNKPSVAVAQNYVGKTVEDPEEIKKNVVKQLVGSVRWEECIRTFAEMGIDTIIEFGPGNVLTGLAKRIDKKLNTVNINSVETLEKFKELI
ncbi:MAG: ACP S-malonyltransferase [Victivallales bacterium]|nr:ACP S-malonyltransferase [Victivallales bacterium]